MSASLAILPRSERACYRARTAVKLKAWHLLALAGFVYACKPAKPKGAGAIGVGDPNPDAHEPLEPVKDLYVFAHDRATIPIAMAAARRIEAASGIKVHVNEYGSQQWALPIFGSDFLCASGTDGRAGPYGIALARDCNVPLEKVIVHEMIHHLGVGHLVLPLRGIMNAGPDGPLDTISSDDLEALCAVRNCTKFAPEA